MTEWAKLKGIGRTTLRERLKAGWSVKDALTKPTKIINQEFRYRKQEQDMPKYALRRDDNEKEIVDALVKAGCSVYRLNGPGLPDLLVGRARKNYLLEVKKKKFGKLTPEQVYWHQVWKGWVVIVWTPEDALKAVELI